MNTPFLPSAHSLQWDFKTLLRLGLLAAAVGQGYAASPSPEPRHEAIINRK